LDVVIGKRRDLQFAVEKAHGDDEVDGELAAQAGFDFGCVMALVAQRRDADLYIHDIGKVYLVLMLQMPARRVRRRGTAARCMGAISIPFPGF
jgi:hypothetical protein